MARKRYIKDLKIKLQEKSSKSLKLNVIKNYTTMIKKAFFLHSSLLDGSLKFTTAPCCSGQLISVNTPAAAPVSIEVIKNRENKIFMKGSCREHVSA